MRSSAGSVSGWSVRWWAPRLSSRARHEARDQAGERERVVEQLAQPVGVAAEPGVAPERGARGLAGGGTCGLVVRRRPGRSGGSGSAAAASAARRPNTKHSASEFDASRLAPCRPGAGALAHRVEARQRTSARRGRWPRRPSCSGRPGPPGSGRGAGSMPTSSSAAAMLGKRADVDGAHVEARPRARRCARSSASIASATWSRGASSSTKRSPPASSSVAPSPRTASVMRKPSRAPPRAQRGGVELHELEVGQRARRRPRRAAARRRPPRAGWWCAPRARPCRRWRARWRGPARAARRRRARPREQPDAAPLVRRQRGRRARLEHLDALVQWRRARTARG